MPALAQQPAILLVDFGNSRLKWGWLVNGGVAGVQALVHRGAELTELLNTEWARIERPDRVLLASVAGVERTQILDAWLARHWQVGVQRAVSQARAFGVVNAYPHPERLGVDRWLALIAVHRRFHRPACIVDCGTAITIDGLCGNGVHRGGLILPGLGLMRQALVQQTSLPDPPTAGDPGWLATDTAPAVAHGGLMAAVALVERLSERIEQDCARVPLVILSGGDGLRIRPLLGRESRYEPDLVLEGLAAIAEEGEP